MTDEMTIQAQRPSALPYVGLGAVAGAGAGAAVGHFVPQKAFSSWEEAVNDVNSNDSFVKKQIENKKDNAEAVKPWNTIKAQAEAKTAADKALQELYPGDFNGHKELDTYVEKFDAAKAAEKVVEDKKQAVLDKELQALKDWTPSEEANAKKTYGHNGKEYTKDELKTLLESTKDDDKKIINEMVAARADAELKGADFAKAEKEAATKAQEELKTAKDALIEKKHGDKVTSESFVEKYKTAKEAAKKAETTAKEEIGKVIDNCKKPKYLIPALVGAAVLGLGGLLLRPSAEEV